MNKGMGERKGHITFKGKALSPHLIDPNNFTHAAYKKQIEDALKAGYSFDGYGDTETSDKSVILRHDEPFSPTASLAIAKINHELEIKGTFFFDPSNEFYDMESDEVQKIIVEIQQLGQDISLKINPKNEKGEFLFGAALETKAAQDKEKFTDSIGVEPTVYALDVTGIKEAGFEIPTDTLAGMASTYGHQFADGKDRSNNYNGNSNGVHLYDKSFLDEVKDGAKSIHLLVHPCWISEKPMLPYQCLLALPEVQKNLKALQSTIKSVHKTGRVYIGDGWKPAIDFIATKIMNAFHGTPSPKTEQYLIAKMP